MSNQSEVTMIHWRSVGAWEQLMTWTDGGSIMVLFTASSILVAGTKSPRRTCKRNKSRPATYMICGQGKAIYQVITIMDGYDQQCTCSDACKLRSHCTWRAQCVDMDAAGNCKRGLEHFDPKGKWLQAKQTGRQAGCATRKKLPEEHAAKICTVCSLQCVDAYRYLTDKQCIWTYSEDGDRDIYQSPKRVNKSSNQPFTVKHLDTVVSGVMAVDLKYAWRVWSYAVGEEGWMVQK